MRGVSQLVPNVGKAVSENRDWSRSTARMKLARSAANALTASSAISLPDGVSSTL
jgi:hypothetical protein